MHKLKLLFLNILFLLSLASCSGELCIDADDFGFSKFTISSRYDKSLITSLREDMQVAPWVNSNFILNGRPLAIMVRNWEYETDFNDAGNLSAWCPWFSDNNDGSQLSKMCERLNECTFPGGKMSDLPNPDAPIENPPCLLKRGVGLYALLPYQGVDPNASLKTQMYPSEATDGINMHLGIRPPPNTFFDTDRLGNINQAGGVIYNYGSPAEAAKFGSNNLYFKILDKFYDDNSGQYRLVIKSGVTDTSNPDPITYITNLVESNIFGDDYNNGIIHDLFMGITTNTSFRLAVTSMMTILVMLTGLSFATGYLQVSHTVLLGLMFKLCLVSMLLGPTSWSFFYNHLFFIFVEGIKWYKTLIEFATSSGSGSTNILGLMLSPETFIKLFSLLFHEWRGFIFIILYFVALYYIIMMLLYAAILYLTSVIIIGMIIVMGPIFICFLLFKPTRDFFDNWLKQLISYAFQPVILLTGIGFISLLIRDEIYAALGFRVCKEGFPDLGEIGVDLGIMNNSIFYWWFPKPEIFAQIIQNIPIPIDHFIGPVKDNNFCPAYGCMGDRYIELPYLDPKKDMDKINAFFSGQFVQFNSLLLLFVCVYLLEKFNSMSVSMAKFLAGNSGMTNIHDTSKAAFAPIQKFINTYSPITKASNFVSQKASQLSDYTTTLISDKYGRYMQGKVAEDALTSGANKTVLREVKRKYGMDIKDINVNANKEYQAALLAKIKEADPKLTQAEALKKHEEMLKKDSFDEIDPKYQTNKLKLLYAQRAEAAKFQSYYVQAHQDLSKQGLGLFGKNIKAFRAYKNIRNEMKRNDAEKAQTRKLIGEKIISGAQSVPYSLAKGLLGDELAGKIIPQEFRGSAWHDHDITDSRLRTYNEVLQDEQRVMDNNNLQKEIDKQVVINNQDIFRPEYLAGLEDRGELGYLNKLQGLEEQKIAADVHEALISGKNPVLMGDKFIKEKASSSQLIEMIDQIEKVRKKDISEDRYLQSEMKYEAIYAQSAEGIRSIADILKKEYKLDKIDPNDIGPMYRDYLAGKNVPPKEIDKEIKDLNISQSNFENSRKILDKIEERKTLIYNEYNKYINDLNKVRKDNGMAEYEKPQTREAKKHLYISAYINE